MGRSDPLHWRVGAVLYFQGITSGYRGHHWNQMYRRGIAGRATKRQILHRGHFERDPGTNNRGGVKIFWLTYNST